LATAYILGYENQLKATRVDQLEQTYYRANAIAHSRISKKKRLFLHDECDLSPFHWNGKKGNQPVVVNQFIVSIQKWTTDNKLNRSMQIDLRKQ
jgi:hypothetical protein